MRRLVVSSGGALGICAGRAPSGCVRTVDEAQALAREVRISFWYTPLSHD